MGRRRPRHRQRQGVFARRLQQLGPVAEVLIDFAVGEPVTERIKRDAELNRHRIELGVGPSASADDVSKAFKRVAKRCHPDVTADPALHARYKRALHARDELLAALEEDDP